MGKLMFAVGYVIALAVNMVTYYKYRTTRLRVGVYSLTVVYGFICAMAAGTVYTAIHSRMGFQNGSRMAMFGAVMLTPLLEIVTVLAEKAVRGALGKKRAAAGKQPLTPVSVRDTLDMLTPDFFIVLGCGKIGCHIDGCCYGIECSWGIPTVWAKDVRVFPVQLLEAALIALVIVLCYFLKQRPFYRRGMAYPLTAALYSVVRFTVEFLRWYEPEMRHLVFGLTLWQFCAVIVFIASVVSLIVLRKTGRSEPLPRRAKKN